MTRKKLVLVVIDGLAADAFEAAVASGAAPTLAALLRHGQYRRGVSTFPSLTPVCLSSIATGAHPDVHEIPHLVWYHRRERRIVEYGSSFAAIRAAGLSRSLRDTVVEMNRSHLGAGAVTVFEALEDAGLTTALVNFTCYRGRTRHSAVLPGVPSVHAPRRFFFYNLFESDDTGAPLAVRNRGAGTVDSYAASVGRWLVTRDGFDLLVYYLSDYDFASHAQGPGGAGEALSRTDAHVRALVEAAGGLDELLDRYALVVCSDHGQSAVSDAVRLESAVAGVGDVVVTASNRAGMLYRLPGCREDARTLALRVERSPAVEVVLFREDGNLVARRRGDEGLELLDDYPGGRERAVAASANPNAGDVLVSAAAGWEFCDGGGGHHAGGGSHGSLLAGDSEVPFLSLGIEGDPAGIVDLAPLALAHFGVEAPPYARAVSEAA